MTRPAAVPLPPAVEAAWEHIRAELTLRTGFWLAFLFGGQSRDVAELVARNRDVAREEVRDVEEIAVGPDLDTALSALAVTRTGLSATWLMAPAVRPPDEQAAIWVGLLERLNERRDPLRRTRPSGLVLACPPGTRTFVRDAAPDLWSFRAFTADLDERLVTASTSPPRPHTPTGGRDAGTGPDDEPPTPAVDPLGSPDDPSQFARPIAKALAAGRSHEALRLAREARDGARTEAERVDAHSWLARALDAAGEAAEARRYARSALGGGRRLGASTRSQLLSMLTESVDPAEAVRAAGELVEIARADLSAMAESPFARARLSGALDVLGDCERETGDLRAARETFAEALELDRARTAHGDGVDRQDLSVALEKLGTTELDLGHPDTALTHHTEALSLHRRLRVAAGDTPQTLRGLSVSLNSVGNSERDLGHPDNALVHYTEALDLARRLCSDLGDTPQTLRDLSVYLNKVGDTERDLGHPDAALAHYTESLELCRRLLSTLGDAPETLRDLSVALDKIGDTERDLGHPDAALAHYTESLELARRLHSTLGDTPQTLRDLAISLDNIGVTERDLDHPDAALTHHAEALGLRRLLHTTLGDTPRALRDLSVSLNKVGDAEQELGDSAAALLHHAEALDLRRRLYIALSDTPQTLRDLSVSLGRLGSSARASGDPTRARPLLEEAVEIDERTIERFGATPQALDDLRWSSWELAIALAEIGERVEAVRRHIRAREVYSELRQLAPARWDAEVATALEAWRPEPVVD